MKRCCKTCGQPIPKARLEALPGVDTCKEHSEAVAYTEDDVEIAQSDSLDVGESLSSER